ncbi:hypothetical protein [Nonlabens xiamenensis]|uniref:hypothetical protein n=1 Tax=Nonlabens xiamenensis TaxID=2341043 RepID=UPI000F60D0FE|nr:hypothetical protein [Nonlabens xiamenensis]
MEIDVFAKDAILTDHEKNLVRKCLFLYQSKMWREYNGVSESDRDAISNIIDKLHLKHDYPTYHK